MSTTQYLVQVLVTLIVLGGGLYFLIKTSKKFQKYRFSGQIKIKDRIAVSQNVFLLLVEVESKQYFLGVGGKDIRLIKALEWTG